MATVMPPLLVYLELVVQRPFRKRTPAPLTKRARLRGDSETRSSERSEPCQWGKPPGTPGKLETGAFPQDWPFPASSTLPRVNRTDREFVVGLFGSPNRTRMYNLLVDSQRQGEAIAASPTQ